MYYTIGDYIFFTFIGFLCLILAVRLFVYLPATAIAEQKCLAAGYPKAAVTWNLERYCMNFEGTVTVTVDEI